MYNSNLNMNIDTLLSNSGVDVTSIKKMLTDKNYKELYSSYPKAIEFMCFVTSEYEFNDFISEMGEIDEEAFLLALAATHSLCSWFGVNEEDEMEQYKKSLNGEYTVIFNDRYNEGTYYIFPIWSMPCLITTERLVIRPVEKDDCEAIHRYAGDPSIDMMMFLPKETFEDTKKFVEFAVSEWAKEDPEDMEFVVLLNGEIIGGVNLEKCEADKTYEIGWILREDMRGKGYATEAAKALMDYAFDVLNAEKVQAHCDSRNQASEKVMKKLGMTLVDDTAIRYYSKRDVFSGEYLYAILKR